MNTEENESVEAKKGQEQLRRYMDDWSSGVGALGVNATYAIIAANWAVHSKADAIKDNTWAMASIAICISALALYLMMTGTITELLCHRWRKAEKYKCWWIDEYRRQSQTKWPFTSLIESLGQWLRYVKVLAPVAAGIFFLKSLQ